MRILCWRHQQWGFCTDVTTNEDYAMTTPPTRLPYWYHLLQWGFYCDVTFTLISDMGHIGGHYDIGGHYLYTGSTWHVSVWPNCLEWNINHTELTSIKPDVDHFAETLVGNIEQERHRDRETGIYTNRSSQPSEDTFARSHSQQVSQSWTRSGCGFNVRFTLGPR